MTGEARTPQEGALVEAEAVLRDCVCMNYRPKRVAALDSLLAYIKQLEGRLALAERHTNVEAWRIADERAESYRAQVKQLEGERERDEKAQDWLANDAADFNIRTEAAERENERLAAALKEIADERAQFHPIAGYSFDVDVRKIARAALAEERTDA